MKLMFALLFLLVSVKTSWGLNCYACSNDAASPAYDPSCDNPDGSTKTYDCETCNSCGTLVYEDGKIERGVSGDAEDGECYNFDYVRYCYCTHDLCNDQLCEQCQ
ncbi:unnamed protein product [Meganyctiphanes norvegica]|uniref:Uncharacterized protein n=1 Tax=Meganyctiphanes norvegica TaxID=48144 RepID=A0AAV2QHD8_MEGNR